MTENVTANYSKTGENFEHNINAEAKRLSQKLNISERVEKIAHNSAYITTKDHKSEFSNTIKCTLINHTKSNVGKSSKELLWMT